MNTANTAPITRTFVEGQKLVGIDILDAFGFQMNYGLWDETSDLTDPDVADCMFSREGCIRTLYLDKIGITPEHFAQIPGEWIMIGKDGVFTPDPWIRPSEVFQHEGDRFPQLDGLQDFPVVKVPGLYLHKNFLVLANDNSDGDHICLCYSYFIKV
jgi:hypothetical protein